MKRIGVVGAGPAGAAAAMALCRYDGLEVVMFDRATFPRRKACGSGLSPWSLELLDQLGLGAKIRAQAFHIGAARIGARYGQVLELRSHYQAAVLLRETFDNLLAQEAVKRGASLRDGVRVTKVVRGPNGDICGLQTSDGEVEVDGVVIANGAKTTFAPKERPSEILHSYMGWYEGVDDVIDAVELYFDPILKPYYGWLFPESLERVNIGIVFAPTPDGPNAKARFHQFVEERFGPRMKGATLIGKFIGHPISITSQPRGLVEQGLLVAGEAGSLVDPATAEGIHHALASGLLAGEMFGELDQAGQPFSAARLAPYEQRVRKRLGRRLMAGAALRKFARTPMFDWMISMGASRPVRALLTWMLAGA